MVQQLRGWPRESGTFEFSFYPALLYVLTLCKNGLGVIDATRVSDGSFVMLKRVKADSLSELEIIRVLSSEPLASDPRNHCNPLLDVLPLPDPQDGVLVVTHMLRPFDNPRFETIGEAVAFFSQIFVVRSSPVHNLLDAVLIVYRACNSCTNIALRTGMDIHTLLSSYRRSHLF